MPEEVKLYLDAVARLIEFVRSMDEAWDNIPRELRVGLQHPKLVVLSEAGKYP